MSCSPKIQSCHDGFGRCLSLISKLLQGEERFSIKRGPLLEQRMQNREQQVAKPEKTSFSDKTEQPEKRGNFGEFWRGLWAASFMKIIDNEWVLGGKDRKKRKERKQRLNRSKTWALFKLRENRGIEFQFWSTWFQRIFWAAWGTKTTRIIQGLKYNSKHEVKEGETKEKKSYKHQTQVRTWIVTAKDLGKFSWILFLKFRNLTQKSIMKEPRKH